MGKPGPKPDVTEEDVLDVFAHHANDGEPLTAPELAEELGCSRRTALNRLNSLVDSGALLKKSVGGRAAVFWRPARLTHAAAEPLRELTGILDDDEADRVRQRSKKWRESFDEELEV